MQREFVALGGALDPEGKRPPIGGSAYLLRCDDVGLLIDCGIYPQSEKLLREYAEQIISIEFKEIAGKRLPVLPPPRPLNTDFIPEYAENCLPNLEALKNLKEIYVIITHAHADHCGSLPFLKRIYPQIKTLMTRETLEIARWSWFDYLKVMRRRERRPLFTRNHIFSLIEETALIAAGGKKSVGPFELAFFPAGHILGSISVYVKIKEPTPVSLFFTSDINFRNQRTAQGAPLLNEGIPGGVDYLITETTYAGRILPPRQEIETRLVTDVRSCLESGGKALLPVLAIGRAAEAASILSDGGITSRWPVWIDGSAQTLMSIYAKYGAINSQTIGEFVEGDMFERMDIINNSEPCVILAPAGMMVGGWSVFYAKHLARNEKNLIGLTCYQEKFTPGRRLLSVPRGQRVCLDNEFIELNAKVNHYHLSSHSQGNEIIQMIERLGPRRGTFLVHGEEEGISSLCQSLPGRSLNRTLLGKVYPI